MRPLSGETVILAGEPFAVLDFLDFLILSFRVGGFVLQFLFFLL